MTTGGFAALTLGMLGQVFTQKTKLTGMVDGQSLWMEVMGSDGTKLDFYVFAILVCFFALPLARCIAFSLRWLLDWFGAGGEGHRRPTEPAIE